MDLIIFEDHYADGFYPLSVSHPVFDLFYGCFNVVERYKKYFTSENVFLVCRDYLTDIARLKFSLPVNEDIIIKNDCLFINAALKPDNKIFDELFTANDNTAFFDGDVLIGAKLSSDILNEISLIELSEKAITFPQNVARVDISAPCFKFLWDIINFNRQAIEDDLKLMPDFAPPTISPYSHIYGENVFLHPTAIVPEGVYIDASNGPVIVDESAVIEPRSLIQGPVYIGKESKVLAGIIREGCSLGPGCKIGGELEESIILGYSNKAHEGFIGHSYIGEWVNLGALTANSDLKNNYSEITVRLQSADIPTGSIKVGCFIGDHTKTGIGTLLNTGMVIGFCCNVYGGALFTEKEIDHFKWGVPGNLVKFKLDKAIDIAQNVMSRRGMEFTQVYKELFRIISDLKR